MRNVFRAAMPSIFAAALVAFFVTISRVAAQSCADVPSQFRFKQAVRPGTPSYIVAPDQPVNVLQDVALPPVVLDITFLDVETGNTVLDQSLDGSTVDVDIEPQLRMGGNSVEISQGEALFTALVIQEPPLSGVDYYLTFRVSHPGVAMSLQTGRLNFVPASDQLRMAALRFGNFGYFFRQQRTRLIPVNQPLPMFFVEAINSLGHPVAQQISVAVSSSDGQVTPTSLPGTGRVQFNDMVYTPSSPAVESVIFTFTATDGTSTAVLSTTSLTPQFLPTRNQFMLFDPQVSFLAHENIGDTAVRDLSMPRIVIQLYTSNMQPDRSNTGLVVTAHTEQGMLRGAEALVVRGRAVFQDLAFVGSAPRSAVITFVAGSQSNLPIRGLELYSGTIQVAETSIKAMHLAFATSSFIQEGLDRQIRKSVNGDFFIPSIIVQVKDSAYQIDSTANGIDLQLVVEPGTVRADPSSATVVNGIAAFSNIAFSGAENEASVMLRIVDSADIRQPLTSGTISLSFGSTPDQMLDLCADASTSCPLSIRFADSPWSYISAEDQEFFTTVGGKIPDIRIRLLDEFGSVVTSFSRTPPKLVAFASDSPETDTLLIRTDSAHEGVWLAGEFFFGCLIFGERPNGLVRLNFRLVDSSGRRFAGVNDLRTGFVSITRNPTPNFGLRFAQEDSLITYPGQPSSAVVNIALPTITIEMVDSMHQFDNSNSDVIIIASSSSGLLDTDGNREVMSRGRATFSTLKFTAIGAKPVVTFTALQSTSHPVAGRTVSTGILTVTTLPIRSFEIVFAPTLGPHNMVSHPFQSFDVEPGQPIRVSIAIRDSAHQFEPVATESVNIELTSTEATLDDAAAFVVTPPGPAGANFSNRIRDVRSGFSDVFFTYTVSGGENPLLTGKSLTIGPIRVAGTASQTCNNQLESPTAVAELRMPLAEFLAQQEQIQVRIAYMMGIETSRVLITNPRTASGIEHDTLVRWTGTKIDVTFDRVQSDSTNRKTSAQLFSEFIALRPTCERNGLCIAAVYSKEVDRGCDVNNFFQLLNASQACTMTQSECECYADQMFRFNDGQVCKDEPTLEDTYLRICRELSTCRSASIQAICDDILRARSGGMLWLWATLGSVGGVVVILLLLKQRGLIRKPERVSLNSAANNGLF